MISPDNAPQLTPARKRLIRQALRDHGTTALDWLYRLPAFAGVPQARIRSWFNWERDRHVIANALLSKRATIPTVTQATATPAAPDPDPAVTGEWYSALAIAKGLDIGVERVYGWRQFGWLQGGPLYTAADIRAFVRGHPLEIRHRDLSEASWLWLVSVLAGSRD